MPARRDRGNTVRLPQLIRRPNRAALLRAALYPARKPPRAAIAPLCRERLDRCLEMGRRFRRESFRYRRMPTKSARQKPIAINGLEAFAMPDAAGATSDDYRYRPVEFSAQDFPVKPMKKEQIVEVLETIATLLELQEENPFKIRAYTNAARSIETWGGNLRELAEENRLEEIPGRGQGDRRQNLRPRPDRFVEILRRPAGASFRPEFSNFFPCRDWARKRSRRFTRN